VSAQAERLEAVLKDAGIPVRRLAAKETNHNKLNENLGLPDDPPTKALFEFVDEALKKQAAGGSERHSLVSKAPTRSSKWRT